MVEYAHFSKCILRKNRGLVIDKDFLQTPTLMLNGYTKIILIKGLFFFVVVEKMVDDIWTCFDGSHATRFF